MADNFSTTFRKLQVLPNVIGIDLIQETSNANYGIANAAAMMTLVKARGVTLPITVSTSENITAAAGGPAINAVAAAGFDFLDPHLYTYTIGTGPAPTNLLQYLRQQWPDKDVLIGEFGTSRGGDSAFEETFAADILALGNSGDPGIRGSLVWAASDQNTLNGQRFGVYDETFAIRQQKANSLRRFTGGSLSRAGASRV
jgi:hypothetical protein